MPSTRLKASEFTYYISRFGAKCCQKATAQTRTRRGEGSRRIIRGGHVQVHPFCSRQDVLSLAGDTSAHSPLNTLRLTQTRELCTHVKLLQIRMRPVWSLASIRPWSSQCMKEQDLAMSCFSDYWFGIDRLSLVRIGLIDMSQVDISSWHERQGAILLLREKNLYQQAFIDAHCSSVSEVRMISSQCQHVAVRGSTLDRSLCPSPRQHNGLSDSLIASSVISVAMVDSARTRSILTYNARDRVTRLIF